LPVPAVKVVILNPGTVDVSVVAVNPEPIVIVIVDG
jgi:hypothetical protein